MGSVNEQFVQLLIHLTTEDYLDTVVWQVLGYTAADVVIVLCLLQVSSIIARGKDRRIVIRYVLLFASLAMSPAFVFVAATEVAFVFISAATAGLHYLIIVYTLFEIRGDAEKIFAGLAARIADKRGIDSGEDHRVHG